MPAQNTFVLYTYELSHLGSSHKVRLVYLLKGRSGEKGIVERLGGSWLAAGCFMVPEKHDADVQVIMLEWHAKFSRRRIMLIN